jgi:hypothetical protein
MDKHECNFDMQQPFLVQFIKIMQDELCKAIDGAQAELTFIPLALSLVQGVLHFIASQTLSTREKTLEAVKTSEDLQLALLDIFDHIESCTDYAVQLKLACIYHKLLSSADTNEPELRKLVEAAQENLQSLLTAKFKKNNKDFLPKLRACA